MNLIFDIKVFMILIYFVDSSLSFGSFVRNLLDQISESDPTSIKTLTLLRIDGYQDSSYLSIEDDIVHDIMTKVQPDYSVFYPPIVVYPDRFELTNYLGSLTILVSDLWNKKVINSVNTNH